MQNLSYENEFYLHVNENSFSYERLCTKTRFEKEVQDNSKMAFFFAAVEDKVIVTFECVDEILSCDHSNESY